MVRKLELSYRPISALRPDPKNPRTHSQHQIRQIAGSIREFEFVNPVLVDETGTIIAGHGRLEAAILEGYESIPVIVIAGLSEAGRRTLAIADNKIAANAGWDLNLLAAELEFVEEVDFDLLSVTGFEVPEIDLLLTDATTDGAADVVPTAPATAVTQPGDLWRLDDHRLLCADATQAASFERLLAGERAQAVFTDPPYNVAVQGHVGGRGRIQHREFAMASGELSDEEFIDFLHTTVSHLVDYSVDGSLHYLCMDWRHAYELQTACRGLYAGLVNLCIWNKNNGGQGSLYRSKHELVLVYKNGTAPHCNNVRMGKFGRNRTNMWDYAGANTFGEGRQDLALHPTVKPVALIADAILDCTDRGGIVLDCFAGSGSTVIAAEKTKRRAYTIELDPIYVDVAIKRWQAYSGGLAIHADTGLSFSDLSAQRQANNPTVSKNGDRGMTESGEPR